MSVVLKRMVTFRDLVMILRFVVGPSRNRGWNVLLTVRRSILLLFLGTVVWTVRVVVLATATCGVMWVGGLRLSVWRRLLAPSTRRTTLSLLIRLLLTQSRGTAG